MRNGTEAAARAILGRLKVHGTTIVSNDPAFHEDVRRQIAEWGYGVFFRPTRGSQHYAVAELACSSTAPCREAVERLEVARNGCGTPRTIASPTIAQRLGRVAMALALFAMVACGARDDYAAQEAAELDMRGGLTWCEAYPEVPACHTDTTSEETP